MMCDCTRNNDPGFAEMDLKATLSYVFIISSNYLLGDQIKFCFSHIMFV